MLEILRRWNDSLRSLSWQNDNERMFLFFLDKVPMPEILRFTRKLVTLRMTEKNFILLSANDKIYLLFFKIHKSIKKVDFFKSTFKLNNYKTIHSADAIYRD